MADVLVDTDRFIDHLRGFERLTVVGDRVHYSTVTRCELFAGSSTEERRIKRLLEPFTELPVDRAVAERAGRLRRGSSMRMADALIAASALEHRFELVTRNQRDFEGVKGLPLRGA